mgnify:CR=1 FL=1
MIWGCIGSVGELAFIKNTMDHSQYLVILKETFHRDADKIGIGDSFHVYQDNDPKQKAWNV